MGREETEARCSKESYSPLTVDGRRVMRVRGACGRRAKEWLWMLDAGTLVCIQSSSRKRVNSDWAMPSRGVGVQPGEHGSQPPGVWPAGGGTTDWGQ